MDRLTEWTGYKWIAKQDRLNGKVITDRDIYNKLAEYEDTGFEPEDILSNIKTLSNELNNALEKQIAKEIIDDGAFGLCPNCKEEFNSELISEYNIKHCPYCGQRLIRI
ncbi:MAG TPA: hypothetical protein VFC70_01040 [Oscillospiraceae bacterium]|nr:hypothetical protein [Oscillospiraceae bacterium]